MPDEPKAPTVQQPVQPQSEWDNPSDYEVSNAAPEEGKPAAPVSSEKPEAAQPDEKFGAALDRFEKTLERFAAQREEKPEQTASVVKKFKLELKNDLDDTYDEKLVAALKKRDLAIEQMNDHYADQLRELEELRNRDREEWKAAQEKLGEIERDTALTAEERNLASIFDELPDDAWREVYRGDAGRKNLREVAKQVRELRDFYKQAGRKVPGDKELFVKASAMLFLDKWESIRKDGRRRSNKGPEPINRVSPRLNGEVPHGPERAKAALAQLMAERGESFTRSTEPDEDVGF